MVNRKIGSAWIGLLLGAVLVLTCAGMLYAWHWLHRDIKIVAEEQPGALFEVERGDSVGTVLRRFEADYDLQHRSLLILYARLTGLAGIRRGEYLLPSNVSPLELLKILNDGKVFQRSLTVVEGSTVNDFLQMLKLQSGLQQTLELEDAQTIAARLGIANGQLEGWLFPDTYYFVKGSSDWALLQRAYQRMQAILQDEWQQRDAGLPYATPYEALIMASIIEKETGAAHERGQIAGVFVRRLQQGMRLQTDPTVIYGLGRDFDGNITRKHLREVNAYNTYVIEGLPPTPIALPGREAIHAALHPQPGDSLYFVARGDGTHVFSTTLAEHQQAVNQYQRRRKENYRSY